MTGAQGPMTDFYHYTCGHSAPLILQSGVVKPLGQLTNLAGRMPPDPDAPVHIEGQEELPLGVGAP